MTDGDSCCKIMLTNTKRLVIRMRIAICDDQVACLEQTMAAIKKCIRGTDARIDSYKSASAFLRGFQEHPYDLVFLDIEMPELDGISAAKKLRAISSEVYIVFLTGHLEFAVEGYEVNALRFLTKPLNLAKLQEVLDLVVTRMRKQRILWIKTELGEQKIRIQDILYMEAQNQNILIFTRKETYCVRYNLSNYEQELAQDGFFRIHRGYLVSLAHIKNVGKNEVTLDDKTQLPVSRSKEKELKEALFQHIRKESF